jgi:nicotinate phosphoribosyltransferase
MGGFDATSNVLAGQIFGIPLKGTHAHAYVTSFVKSDGDRQPLVVPHSDGVSESCTDFMSLVRKHAGTVFKLCGECGFVVDPNEVRAQESTRVTTMPPQPHHLDAPVRLQAAHSAHCTAMVCGVSVFEVSRTDRVRAFQGELVAFATYAFSFPAGFLALVDTYDVMKSGMPNYMSVVMALHDFGYRGIGEPPPASASWGRHV